jgi:hypothetical protein
MTKILHNERCENLRFYKTYNINLEEDMGQASRLESIGLEYGLVCSSISAVLELTVLLLQS